MVRVGPAGWLYKDWEGTVYPSSPTKGFDPLEYISEYFTTVEINSSFYGPPKAAIARTWTERVSGAPDFRFTAKLWRRFTHERESAWTADEVKETRAAFDALQDANRLGAVLLQFPWSFRNEEGSREWLGDLISSFAELPLVVEVRHSTWLVPAFFRELVDRGVGIVNIDQPVFSDSVEPSAHVTAPVGYVRLHGRNYQDWWRKKAESHERYNYLYSAAELRPWVERVREIATEVEDLYVVTNNHFEGKAAANGLMLRSMLENRKVRVPGALQESYREVLEPFSERQ